MLLSAVALTGAAICSETLAVTLITGQDPLVGGLATSVRSIAGRGLIVEGAIENHPQVPILCEVVRGTRLACSHTVGMLSSLRCCAAKERRRRYDNQLAAGGVS